MHIPTMAARRSVIRPVLLPSGAPARSLADFSGA
jgi:hypothetical protein